MKMIFFTLNIFMLLSCSQSKDETLVIPDEDCIFIMGFSSGLLWGALAGYQLVFPKGMVLSCKKTAFHYGISSSRRITLRGDKKISDHFARGLDK